MKDEEFPKAFHFDEGNKELSLDEIMAQDANDDATEDKLINSQRRKTKVKKATLITGTSILAVAVTAGFLFFTPFGGDLNFNKSGKTAEISQETQDAEKPGPVDPDFMSGGTIGDTEKFAQEDANRFPVELADWEKKRHNDQDANELTAEILKKNSGTELSNMGGMLPSEKAGFTSDVTKVNLPDGTMNPMFSFWTAESFSSETGEHIQRLLNPTFGGWSSYQYSSYPGNKYFDTSLVADMFTGDWRVSNLEKPFSEYIPIYADWVGDDYGMADKLLTSGERWYGKVTSSATTLTYNEEELQYSADVTAQVTFTAWAKDQTKLEKKGTLTLHLVPNIEKRNDSAHKVLIESASLKVDG